MKWYSHIGNFFEKFKVISALKVALKEVIEREHWSVSKEQKQQYVRRALRKIFKSTKKWPDARLDDLIAAACKLYSLVAKDYRKPAR